MKKLIPFFVVILLAVNCVGQDFFLDSIPASAAEDESGNVIRPPKRFQTNWTIGTSFTTTSGYGSGFSTYISPSVSYRISPRFTIRGGVTLSNTTLFNYRPWYSMEATQPFDANFTNAMVWVEGSYMVTDKLMISGAGFKQFTLTDNSPAYNPYTNNNPYGVYLNATYKINDRMFIQAGFGYTRNQQPYTGSSLFNPSPFSRGAFHQMPFQNDPFNSNPFNNDPFRW